MNRLTVLFVNFVILFLTLGTAVSAVESRYCIDYSESGESIFFTTPTKNHLIVTINENIGDNLKLFYISRGAHEGPLTITVKNGNYTPQVSYDRDNWDACKNVSVRGNETSFTYSFEKEFAWIALDSYSANRENHIDGKNSRQPSYYPLDKIEKYVDSKKNHPYVSYQVLGKSVQNREVALLTVTNTEIPDTYKRYVWLQFRIHGNENEQSYIFEGLLNFVLSEDPIAKDIRNRMVLKLIPVINPDGVVRKTRQNFNGIDLNRNYSNPTAPITEEPEVQAVHKEIDKIILDQKKDISFLIDFHGWGGGKDGGYRTKANASSKGYENDHTTFLKLLCNIDPWQRMQDWQFSDGHPNMGRIALLKQHNQSVITSETTSGRRKDGSETTVESLHEQGRTFALGVFNYVCHINFTDSNFKQKNHYRVGEGIYVNLIDDDARSTEPTVTIKSLGSGDEEKVTFTESRAGNFKSNVMNATVGKSIPNDGILQVKEYRDEIIVQYYDSDFKNDSAVAVALIESGMSIVENGMVNSVAVKMEQQANKTYVSMTIPPHSQRSSFTLRAVNGKTLFKSNNLAVGVNKVLLPANIGKGIYFYSLSVNNKSATQKILIP